MTISHYCTVLTTVNIHGAQSSPLVRVATLLAVPAPRVFPSTSRGERHCGERHQSDTNATFRGLGGKNPGGEPACTEALQRDVEVLSSVEASLLVLETLVASNSL